MASHLYAESLLFQSPHPSKLPFPMFGRVYTLGLLHTGEEYYIRGLWSVAAAEPSLLEFDARKLLPIMDRLQQHWPDKQNHNNLPFWQEEYEKHGGRLTELEYFSKALELFESAMVKSQNWLEKWGPLLHIPVDIHWKLLD